MRRRRSAEFGPAPGCMRRSAGATPSRSASSFRECLLLKRSQPAQPTCADLVGRPRRVAYQEPLLHPGDYLASDVEFGTNPVDTIGMEANHRLGDDRGGIELIRDGDGAV